MTKNDINCIDFINNYNRRSCVPIPNEQTCYYPCVCRYCRCTGVPAPFLSSYIEAVGTAQTVNNNENFIFDITPDILDVVGNDITIDSSGSTFTIVRAGLYRVEWSMNILTAANPVLVGLLENGEPSSALSNNALSGNYSSGALISVGNADLPYRIVLHNFGAPISVTNPSTALNTAVSIRISRFADAPNN